MVIFYGKMLSISTVSVNMSTNIIKVLCLPCNSFARKTILKNIDVSMLRYIPQTPKVTNCTLK